jgi:hypothetical protein
VNLTRSVTSIIRKAEQLAARSTASRARKRLASLIRKSSHGKARSMIAARAAGKSAKARAIRLASSER